MTRHAARLRHQDGFTVVEMLVAVAITLAVTAATFALMDPAQGTFAAQPEVADMQQRLRIGVDVLTRDLLMAGGGAYSGSMTGLLGGFLAPILPYRIGSLDADPAGQFHADRVTMMYVPQTAAQTTIADPITSTSAAVTVTRQPGCPTGDQVCGFTQGMTVLIMDGTGSWDSFTVGAIQGPVLQLRHQGAGLNKAYPAGSYISQLTMYTYWLKADEVADSYQLMRYDGNQTDVPVADNLVGLSFEVLGEPSPPQLRPGLTPATTYGPAPPAFDIDNPADSWGAGENCVFTRSADAQLPRLDWLDGGGGGLVTLTPAQLTDGPWCPDAAAPGRYDADLLRIRSVRVTLRVQAANPSLRGHLPDQEIRFDLTPRNLTLGR